MAGVTRDRVTYLMHVEDRYFELVDTGGIGIVDVGDAEMDLKIRTDFIPELWSVSGTVSAPLELVDEHPNVDLKGKIAVEMEDRIPSDDPEFPANATEGRKLEQIGKYAVLFGRASKIGLSRGAAGSNLASDHPLDHQGMTIAPKCEG